MKVNCGAGSSWEKKESKEDDKRTNINKETDK